MRFCEQLQLFIKYMDRGIPSFNRVVVQKMQQSMQTHYQILYSKQVKLFFDPAPKEAQTCHYQQPSLTKFASFQLILNPRHRYAQQDSSSQNDELKQIEVYFKKQMLKLEVRRRSMNASATHNSPSLKKMHEFLIIGKSRKIPRRKSTILLNKSILLFAIFKKIGKKIFKVKINRRHNLYEVVCMDASASDQKLTIKICQEEENELLSAMDYDYETIVYCLQVNKEISLDREKLRNCKQDFSRDLPLLSQMKLRAKKRQSKLLSNINKQPNQSSAHFQEFQGQPQRMQALPC